MNEWKVGDRVKVLSRSYLYGISTITEITRAGNIRINYDKRLYNKDGSLRGGNIWGCERIVKITEEEFNQLSQLKDLNKKVDKIVNRLQGIIRERKDEELLKYGEVIKHFYEQIIED